MTQENSPPSNGTASYYKKAPEAIPTAAELEALSTLYQEGRIAEAKDAAQALTERFPGHGVGWKFLGVILSQEGRRREAFQSMFRAAQLLPRDAQAQSNFGAMLTEAGEPAAAEAFHRRAVEIDPHNASALTNLGNTLIGLRRMDEAETWLRRALELAPGYALGHHNLGSMLHDQGRIDEARACYARALELVPDMAQTHWNEGMCELQAGNFMQGWRQYEWRLQLPSTRVHRFAEPRWTGREPLAGKTVLLHAEQGLGDTLQFCRYAPLVAARGARVILYLPMALMQLLTQLDGVSSVITEGEAPPAFDYHCSLMSLPLAFETDLRNVPTKIPYISAAPGAVQTWRTRLEPEPRRGRRIGVAWAGNPLHRHNHRRSIPVAEFFALADERHAYHVLQKDISPEEKRKLPERANWFTYPLEDFGDTAALIASLDLVITVDTAVAHLAGAMGKPVWILLAFQADWRWLTQREDSPWYPTARLFRQTRLDDWSDVFTAVRRTLEAL